MALIMFNKASYHCICQIILFIYIIFKYIFKSNSVIKRLWKFKFAIINIFVNTYSKYSFSILRNTAYKAIWKPS